MPIVYRDRIKNPTKVSWFMMRQRCNNPRNTKYHRYGGRGISICERWDLFENFVADMGLRPDGKSIDRKDTDGNYTPENCKWSTRKEQMRNRAYSVFVEIDGVRHRAIELAEKSGLKADTIIRRANQGMSFGQVVADTVYIYKEGLSLGGKANGARQKAKTHCKKGHEYNPQNTYFDKNGGRTCRKCHYQKTKRQWQKRALARKLLKTQS